MQLHSSELREYLEACTGGRLPESVWERLDIGDDLELSRKTVKALRLHAHELLDAYHEAQQELADRAEANLDLMVKARRTNGRRASCKHSRIANRSARKRNLTDAGKAGHHRFRARRHMRELCVAMS